ncbi:hypothetical protein RhiirC2_791041 [Rhizophagus irregularis]|uniref:Uncharacterized protein n=1 Tax=Rhizophagus irregularis TaxID=588596 RepID=A0A2N1MK17_9GLOM|nr:hypothetical protein RhiirC2_791041 [Rhizophagus irregularis]
MLSGKQLGSLIDDFFESPLDVNSAVSSNDCGLKAHVMALPVYLEAGFQQLLDGDTPMFELMCNFY